MTSLHTLVKIKERISEKRFIDRTLHEQLLLVAIDNYFSENNYSEHDIKYNFDKLLLDNVFDENDLNNLFNVLNDNDYLKNNCKIFHLLNFRCFKLPKKDLEKIFIDCFDNIEYMDSYNFDFEYNCIHIDNKENFNLEKFIEITEFFQKWHILISYNIDKYEIMITFENCVMSENWDNEKYIEFYFSLLPNKYMRSY